MLNGVSQEKSSNELGPFQLALVVLSVLLLAGLAAELILPVPREIARLVLFIDTAICGLLLVDFLWRLAHAPSKLAFMRWGWLDLLASIPAVEALRFGRLFRVVRVIRLIMALRTYRDLLLQFLHRRREAGLATVLVLAFVMISFASVGMLLVEQAPESNIRTAEDALWWSLVTVTTVGYGDRFPVTDAGRLIATFLMVGGIGVFGTLSGVAASFFLGNGESSTPEPAASAPDGPTLDSLETRIARLEAERDAKPPG